MTRHYGLILCGMLGVMIVKAEEQELAESCVREERELPVRHHGYDVQGVQTGRMFYDSLIKKASQYHVAFPISASFTIDSSGFDCQGRKSSLANIIFGSGSITVRDIYLFARLSDDNEVRINNTSAKAPERGAIPIGQAGVPFGGFRDDLYTTLLAPVQLSFDATERQFTIVPSIIFHANVGSCNRWGFALGINIPFKNVQHDLELTFENGDLFREGFLPQKTQRETSLDQFYRDFSDVEDFLNRAVLAPQGLSFDPYQSKVGFGDISCFGMGEWRGPFEIDLGVNLVFPTGGKDSGSVLWQPVLGNGGAFQLNPFVQVLFSGESPAVNPFVRCAVEYSFAFSTNAVRVPRLISNPVRQFVRNVAGLEAPDFFDLFYVDPFEAYDTTIPAFGARVPLRRHYGTKMLLGVGNYAYRIFHANLRLGLFYDCMIKGVDSFSRKCLECPPPEPSCDLQNPCASCGETSACPGSGCAFCATTSMITTTTGLAFDLVRKNTNQISHTLSANLVYTFHNMCEIGFGGQCVVRGKNVPQYYSLYVSVVALF